VDNDEKSDQVLLIAQIYRIAHKSRYGWDRSFAQKSISSSCADGGLVEKPASLQRRLEEAYGHIFVCKDDIRRVKFGQPRCVDLTVPLWERAEVLMFAAIY